MSGKVDVMEHADYAEEEKHLDDTVKTIGELENVLQDVLNGRASYGSIDLGFDRQDMIVEAFLKRSRKEELEQLQSIEGRPYFGRYDFLKRGSNREETFYVGHVGVNEFRNIDNVGAIYVVDWRSPVGEGFYNIESGKTSFRTPGGMVGGKVLLKRNYEIEDGKLIKIVDDGPVREKLQADPFLQSVLQKGADKRLKDIVATIQREQDMIIRQPMNKTLLVQGVAGSGKTTVGLHRISYLLYRHRKDLKASRIAFIAPNKVFLDYISDVLPGIDARGVRQLTLGDLFAEVINASDPEKKTSKRVANSGRVYRALPSSRESRLHFLKGSLEYKNRIESFCEAWEQRYTAGMKDLKLKIVDRHVVIKAAEMERIIKDVSLALNVRLSKLLKFVKRRAREQLVSQLDLQVVERSRRVGNGKKSSKPQMQQLKLPEVYTKALDKLHVQSSLSEWIRVEPEKLYAEFLRSSEYLELCAQNGVVASANSDEETVMWEQSDFNSLCYMHILLNGMPPESKLDHIVLDEAQDCSPFEIFLLREFSANGSMTLLGDLNQAIPNQSGFLNWQQLQKSIFGDLSCEIIDMVTSYRSAGEIVDFCNKILPVGATLATPVYWRGTAPSLIEKFSVEEAVGYIRDRIEEFIDSGCKSIGVLTRDQVGADYLYNVLNRTERPISEPVILVDDDGTKFDRGIKVLPIRLAKGLEFEAVIIANASERKYPGNTVDQQLLYIGSTRALHHLEVVSVDAISPIFSVEHCTCIDEPF